MSADRCPHHPGDSENLAPRMTDLDADADTKDIWPLSASRPLTRECANPDERELVQVRDQTSKGFRVQADRPSELDRNHQRLSLEALENLSGRPIPKHETEGILSLSQARSSATTTHDSRKVTEQIKR